MSDKVTLYLVDRERKATVRLEVPGGEAEDAVSAVRKAYPDMEKVGRDEWKMLDRRWSR